MKMYSDKITYGTSSGERFTRAEIERKIRKAKAEKLVRHIDTYDYYFCEDCGVNASAGIPIDCSHDISVKECLESSRAQLSWSVDNITLRCRRCHNVHD